MKTNNRFLITAILVLAITLTLSCSGDGANESGGSGMGMENQSSSSGTEANGPVKKDKISGFSQKGPFTRGSTITLYELDGDFAQTGRSFKDMIADDKGSFEIKNVELVSPYAMLEADGYYRNEVTGKISAAPIKLYAIADIREKSNVNVNILTHLEYYRIQKLIENGKSLAEAKKQAQGEILSVFGISGDFGNSEDMSIFGTNNGDAALLAISILLQGDLSEGQFTERLTDFSLGFRETGVWNNEIEKNAMVKWIKGTNLAIIKRNILGWKLSSAIPTFEKFVIDYWYANYGLGNCNSCLTFTDARDNQSYIYVEIGEQTWMAENLNYKANGSLSNEYGSYYDWAAVMDFSADCNFTACANQIDNPHRGVCPEGWHLPTSAEWNELRGYAGSADIAVKKLMATSDWKVTGCTDEFGFALLPSGGYVNGSFGGNIAGLWYSSTEYSSTHADVFGITINVDDATRPAYSWWGPIGDPLGKKILFPVRCVKD